jgi:hypothetical protein
VRWGGEVRWGEVRAVRLATRAARASGARGWSKVDPSSGEVIRLGEEIGAGRRGAESTRQAAGTSRRVREGAVSEMEIPAEEFPAAPAASRAPPRAGP